MPAQLQHVIQPRPTQLGGFEVLRVLPYRAQRSVGPFVFFDHLGPVDFQPGQGIDVRPHPHIGLATVTYLFEGEIVHRDSLGCVQTIRPGAVNWMTAGQGIVHSERTGPELRAKGHRIHGIQSWVALPQAVEETTPAFHHYPAATLPVLELPGAQLRLIAGTAMGREAPVAVFSKMFYMDACLSADGGLVLDDEHQERAVYMAEGAAELDGQLLETGQMAVLAPGGEADIRARGPARLMMLGGEPLDGTRHIWWNFVHSSQERIEAAKADWAANRFPKVPGETEFIPLPEQSGSSTSRTSPR